MQPSTTNSPSRFRLPTVAFFGRTMPEYLEMLAFEIDWLRGLSILDVASGPGSFVAQSLSMGLDVTGCDPLSGGDPEEIVAQGKADIDACREQIRRNPAGPMVEDFTSFLAGVPAEKPFCFWFGSPHPHRPYDQQRLAGTTDPATVSLPPFLPDVPAVRGDLADYFAEVQALDQELGGLLATLEKAGRLDNTLIVVTSDNGMPFPRAKCNLYSSGTRMPLAIRWGARVKPGRVVEDMVSLCDLAPTFLAAAGISAPAGMTGRSLLGILESDKDGVVEPARDHVVVGRERLSASYPCRALHTRDFLYIRNYKPELSPAAADAGPAKAYLLEHEADPAVAKFSAAYAGLRPAEELYDNRKDPDQMKNVAADPQYAAVKEKLARQLDAELVQTGDPRATGHGDVFDSYPDRSPRR